MHVLDRNPQVVSFPPACEEGRGAYSAWAYHVPHTATTTSGLEIPLFKSRLYWSAVNAVDRTNEAINTYGEPLNRVGAIVLARHCENRHDGTGPRVEIDRTLIVADKQDIEDLDPAISPDYNYQTAQSFEPGEETEGLQPLFLPYREDTASPDRIVPVSQGERRILVAFSSGAVTAGQTLIISTNLLDLGLPQSYNRL